MWGLNLYPQDQESHASLSQPGASILKYFYTMLMILLIFHFFSNYLLPLYMKKNICLLTLHSATVVNFLNSKIYLIILGTFTYTIMLFVKGDRFISPFHIFMYFILLHCLLNLHYSVEQKWRQWSYFLCSRIQRKNTDLP